MSAAMTTMFPSESHTSSSFVTLGDTRIGFGVACPFSASKRVRLRVGLASDSISTKSMGVVGATGQLLRVCDKRDGD